MKILKRSVVYILLITIAFPLFKLEIRANNLSSFCLETGESELVSSFLIDAEKNEQTPATDFDNLTHSLDSVLNINIVEQKVAPGAVLCIVKDKEIIYQKAYGYKLVYPELGDSMSVDCVFDLASLSKCFGTSIAVMQLVEKGLINLNAPVERYLPGFVSHPGGRKIRVKDLMMHTSGLDSYVSVDSLYTCWAKSYIEDSFLSDSIISLPSFSDSLKHHIIEEMPRKVPAGKKRIYSCPNFVTLQFIVESITGQRLCDYVQQNVFDVLGLKTMHYLPMEQQSLVPPKFIQRVAPTEYLGDVPSLIRSDDSNVECGVVADTSGLWQFKEWGLLRGVVHDPLARKLNGGNSGNAGIFSNAADLAVFCMALMNGGEYEGRRILRKSTVRKMFKVQKKGFGRTLGWDSKSPYARFVGSYFANSHTISHTGYTGTSVLMDLDHKVAVILLTNRAHPFDEGSVAPLRRAVSEIVGEYIWNLEN